MNKLRALRPLSDKALLVVFACLTSCSQDDRTLTVTCERPPGTPIALETEWLERATRKSATGYLNDWGFSLGTIVRVIPGTIPSETTVVRRVSILPLVTPTYWPTTLTSATVENGLQVHVEEDVRTIGRRGGIDLESGIPKHTLLQIDGAEVRSLTNLANSINAYPGIVEEIRTEPDAHFAIVSGTIDGAYLFLLTTYNGDALNTVSIGTTHVHISYSCRAVNEVLHQVWTADNLVPIVIYLTPIRYDVKTSRVVLDLVDGA